jgi:deazaflavin-dependent oxidoreductase (nitroreductase family)
MKILFRLVTGFHVALYRITGGKLGGKVAGTKVLLLTTTGRRSGKERTSPLGYFEHDGGYVIIASNGGSDHHPGWFYNLKSNPRAGLQVLNKVFEANAEISAPEMRDQLWKQLIEIYPLYTRYEKRTSRLIPMVILRPLK